MTHLQIFQRYGIALKPLQESDLEKVRAWRNSPEIAELMLDQTYITEEMQQKWFKGLQTDSSRAYWVAWFKDEPIGVASLVNIDLAAGTAEPGMYIYPEKYRGNIVPFCMAFALNDYVFEELKLTSLIAEVFSDNQAAMRFNEKCGYILTTKKSKKIVTNVTKSLIYYELNHVNYEQAKKPIAHFIRY